MEMDDSGDVYWINLENPTPEEEHRIYDQFLPVHPLSKEDLRFPIRNPGMPPHLPKVEEFRDYLFVIVNPLNHEHRLDEIQKGMPPKQLSAVLTHHVLITQHYGPLPCVEGLHCYLERHEDMASRGPDYLFHLILDAMVDEYAPLLDQMEDALDTLEAHVLEKPEHSILEKLLGMKREVIVIRKTLILTREVLARLIRGEFKLVDAREVAYYRNVYDHLVRYTELIENAREMVADLMQLHLSSLSNRLNGVMKVLTMISTTILPMSLIAGVYGMNFKLMPELEEPWGYPFALGLMFLTGFSSFLYFRWKKWI